MLVLQKIAHNMQCQHGRTYLFHVLTNQQMVLICWE